MSAIPQGKIHRHKAKRGNWFRCIECGELVFRNKEIEISSVKETKEEK